jgi:hypothetical protein
MELEQWFTAWGISWEQIMTLAVLAVILVVAWLGLRVIFKLTAALFRAGCILIFLLMAGAFLITFFLL